MSSPFRDLDDNLIPENQILGYGRTGLVILREETAVKSSDVDIEMNIKSLQHEQAIYQRLGRCTGIVSYLGFSTTTTELAFMKNGDLRTYLARNGSPNKSLQLLWFREVARTLAHIHDRRVIVADIASRNFLLDSDLSIKFCDFTESTKMPLDTCMETVDDEGYSIQADIGQLGAVIYEVVVGERCGCDLFKDVPPTVGRAAWPRRENLPSTQSIWLGPVIEKCWTKGAFRNARDLDTSNVRYRTTKSPSN
ncbi:serine/threonine protein kinase [Polytolypa hystricis UAMH7299]|uniref:non-specific serine/threonine protein kinase n=1 Tax=Polytolypa hystricis (strain UAMH7299) TaxID=1447883 RepID=A0A2B7XFK6_POLH7|nr:serine/threonine protein kinase [Polytolypa hystricis UAMH7299]